MKQRTLHADQIMAPGEAFHFTRAVISRKPQRQVHDHDYYELFWVQHGQAKQLVNGQIQKLQEGDLVYVRPTDCHLIQGRGGETHVVNIVFRTEQVQDLKARFGLAETGFFHGGRMPDQYHKDARQLAALSQAALRLEAGPRSKLAAEAFLLPLLQETNDPVADLPADAPDWLHRAFMQARRPEVFRDGAAGLVRASGRGHAHVSRTVRAILGVTPTEYMNRIRMAHAARALTGTSDDLAEIAADCGISNLSHFHRLFREHYATTPAAYRRQYQKSVIQPFLPFG